MQDIPAISDRTDTGDELRLRRGGKLWIGATSIQFLRYEAGQAVFDVRTDLSAGQPESKNIIGRREL